MQQLRRAIQNCRAQVSEIENEDGKLKKEIEKQETKFKRAGENISTFQNKISKCQSQQKKLTAKNSHLKSVRAKAQAESEELTQRIDRDSKRCEKMEAKLKPSGESQHKRCGLAHMHV